MDEITLEIRSAQSLSRAHARWLTPPAEIEKEPCKACNGTGVIPGTETEDLYGTPCPEGCPLDRDAFHAR